MLRAIIVDDEEAAVQTLRTLALRMPAQLKIVATANDPLEGIGLIEDFKPDLLFLDINMPGMNGFELLEQLHYRDFKLVFTTAHRDYALEAIKQKAADYLLKPIGKEDLRKCMDGMEVVRVWPAAPAAVRKEAGRLIEVQVKDGIIYIRPDEIIRLEASRSYTVFYLDNTIKHIASRTLREYEALLDGNCFYRCHNSHIINLNKVRKFVNHEGLFALMSDGSKADISKSNKSQFLSLLKELG